MATTYDEFGNVISVSEDGEPEKATPAQLDYYRQKVSEFQDMLTRLDNAADATYQLALASDTADPELSSDLYDQLYEFEQKKSTLKAVAEGLKFAIAGVNSIGGNFPVLRIPAGLGAIPLVAAAGVASALALAAGLIVWGRDWLAAVNERAKRAQLLDVVDPEKKSQVASELLRLDQAQQAAESTPLGSIATAVKWIAIAAAAWLAYNAWQRR